MSFRTMEYTGNHLKLLNSLNLPWPTDWTQIFGTERPLVVEIGFGNGDYLIHLHEVYPDCNILGLEISNKSMEKAEQKIRTRGLNRVRVVNSRAETALHHLLTPQSVHAFHINYPDPWFKKRHSGRRLMQRDTLDAIVNRLEPRGELYLATDIVEYAEMSHELLQETPGLDNELEQAWVHEIPGRYRTKYEEKGLREGRPGHYFRYRRNKQSAPDIPVLVELEMPHLVLTSPQTSAEILEAFTPLKAKMGDGIHVAVLSAFINQRQNVLLFEIRVDEPTIEQHTALMLFPREETHQYTLKYATLGHPRPTLGLHRATRFVGEWIAGLHPEASIISAKVRN